MSAATLFVTGTDTGVGKTRVACALLRRARALGLRAAGFKPVASGALHTRQGLRNEDALALQAAGAPLPYAMVNPYCFEPAIAPHLAAREAGQLIDTARLNAIHSQIAAAHDLVIVEGAGGFLVPLSAHESFGDWAGGNRWPVLLVVALRLGCLNHALLSCEAILRRGDFAGWVANCVPPVMERARENLEELRARLPGPCFGVMPSGAQEICVDQDASGALARGFEDWLAARTPRSCA